METVNKKKESIEKLWNEINQQLIAHNNELLLFDFTTVTHYSNNTLIFESDYYNSIYNYKKLLKEYFKNSGYSIPPLTEDKPEPVLFSVRNYKAPKTCKANYVSSGPETGENKTVFLNTWHKFIEDKKIAGASWILFKDFFSDTADNERIEVGIYILLKKQVGNWTNNIEGQIPHLQNSKTVECEINNFISSKVYAFLFDNGIDYIAKAYKSRKDENVAIKNDERNKTKQYAVRSAISQVMARNSSHNIGSHVLNKLVRGLDEKDFNSRNYQEYIFDLRDHHEAQKNWFDLDKKPLPKCTDITLSQIEYFNSYIKNRMEYLGDIAMNTPMMSSSKFLLNDIFNDFDKVRLLLDNISGLDSAFQFRFNFLINSTLIPKKNWAEFDIKLAIANDVTGCQAFYNILENIIRNTAKHSSGLNGAIVTFCIDVKTPVSFCGDDATEYWQINVYDDVEKDDIDERVNSQNDTLNKNVIDDNTNNLRQGALGMIEMDASAAYLRMIDIADINKDEYEIEYDAADNIYKTKGGKLPILNANKFIKTVSTEPKCLGYQFYIAKPKEILFVVVNKQNVIENKEKGIDCILRAEFIQMLNQNKSFAHQFVITDTDFDESIILHKAQFSPRIMTLLIKEIQELVKDEFIIRTVWQKWTEEKLGAKAWYTLGCNGPTAGRNNNVVFSDHEINSKEIQNCLQSEQNYITYESISSLGQSKLPFFQSWSKIGTLKPIKNYVDQSNKNNFGGMICDFLGDAAHSKILVIDERIQQFSQEIYTYEGNSVPHYILYQAMNVFMPRISNENAGKNIEWLFPTFDYDLSGKELEISLIEKIEQLLLAMTDTKFLVLHYGILERVFGKQKDTEITALLKRWSDTTFKAQEIIVTSGRTRVEGLPKKIRFVNLAPLLTAFIDIRSKYVINKILNDSRI